jgi:hypothetical protein
MESKDRLIYANEVIEEIDEIIGNINFSSPYQNDIHLIVEGLERARYCVLDACTVDAVEAVHGRWIEEYVYDPDPHDRLRYKCSVCGRTEEYREPYCNCGANMDGDGNG